MRDILFVAGETSGDAHASAVARELLERGSGFRLVGVGGDRMKAAGVELIEHVQNLSVMGFVEPLKRLPLFHGLRNALRARLESGTVALVILVDYGGFNLGIAEYAKDAGVQVLYYITPQVWASRAGRVERLARTVSHAAVILPFEEKLLRDHGVRATFVGHPLIDRAQTLPSRADARRELGIADDVPLLALFPGSRQQEISRHLEPFVETAMILQRSMPNLRVLVGAAPHVDIPAAHCPFPLVHSGSLPLLRAADAALCKSGTTTLEAAVAGCPFVLGYRTDAISFAVAKFVITIPYIGLVNVLAGREVAPEFVQDDLVPSRVAAALAPLMDLASPSRASMLQALAEVRESLGEPGAARRVASLALDLAGAA